MTSDPAPRFGALLRSFRLAAGLTQEALAERAGLSARAVSSLEGGQRSAPYPDTVRQLARALRLSAADRARLDAAHPRRAVAVPTPPSPAPAPPTNLPAALTSFIGREQALAELTRRLGATRLLTLTGTGGVGKTRLALQVAADRLDDYPDGVWFVDLAPLTDPELVGRAVAGVLGIVEQPGQPIEATLVSVLRLRTLLLVLDNCEHLLDACASMAEALLQGCSRLCLLATSREALGSAGEVPWRIPSLATPDPEQLPPLDELVETAAVRLFAERARIVQPTFSVTAENAAAVAQVCWRLDGIPLALELAAARLSVLTVDQIVARLDDRFQLLTGGRRTALRRQQTLAAALDWSHDLLADPERILLRRLSVFVGGWMLEAAEAVGSGDGIEAGAVLDLLTQLVAKSLVVVEAAGAAARYRLLETVRQYAEDKLLAAGEAAAARDRHLAWAVALAEMAEPALRGREQIAWQDRLEREHDNLRAALRWAEERGAAEAALRLTGSLLHFWQGRHYLEARAHYEAALALPGAAAPTAARALALVGAGWMTLDLGDFPTAQRYLDEALVLAEQVREPRIAALALALVGNILSLQGDTVAGKQHAEAALRRAEAAGDAWVEALALRYLASKAGSSGDQAALRYWTDRRLAGVHQLGTPWLEMGLHVDLARLARSEGDRGEERAHREKALALARALADTRSIGAGSLYLADLTLDEGDLATARQYSEVGLRLVRDVGNRWELPRAVEGVAGLAATTGRPVRALRLAGAAAAMRATLAIRPTPAEVENLDRWLAPARQALSVDEQAAAWAEGEALPLEEAIAEALADDSTD